MTPAQALAAFTAALPSNGSDERLLGHHQTFLFAARSVWIRGWPLRNSNPKLKKRGAIL
jgi:hypothetical protein